MRKLITLVAVLFLVAVLAQAQDATPVNITLSATIEAGCYLDFTPTSVSWTLGVNSESGAWVSGDAPLDYTINYRLATGHTMRLFQESLTDFVYGDMSVIAIETYGKQVFTGDVVYEGNLRVEGANAQLIGQSVDDAGSMTGQVDFQFFNDPTLKAGTVTATIQYTAIDFI